jgi:acetyl-CoA C-acetyltransferase
MSEAYIVDALRLPRALAKKGGAYAALKPVDLLKPLFEALSSRHNLDSSEVEDVLLGCSTQSGDQGANLGKIASLYAGWSAKVSGASLNRFCCSGLDAINLAASKVMAGMESLVVAGGVEQISRVPMFADKGAWFSDPTVMGVTQFMHMGLSADLIAVQQGFTRKQLDALSIESHQRAHRAREARLFDRSLVLVKDKKGQDLLSSDNAIRSDVSSESLAALPPAFSDFVALGQSVVSQVYPNDTLEARHSVGNSPALVDGASLVLIASKASCESLGFKPRAHLRHFANASDEPVRMLTGHIRATEKLLRATGLSPADIDRWEVNESFAASVLHYQQTFNIAPDKLNVNGSAIALGHPLGATGGNLLGTLLDELEHSGKARGIVSICGGAGVGVTTLIEVL